LITPDVQDAKSDKFNKITKKFLTILIPY